MAGDGRFLSHWLLGLNGQDPFFIMCVCACCSSYGAHAYRTILYTDSLLHIQSDGGVCVHIDIDRAGASIFFPRPLFLFTYNPLYVRSSYTMTHLTVVG